MFQNISTCFTIAMPETLIPSSVIDDGIGTYIENAYLG